MIFTSDSVLAQLWAKYVLRGTYALEQVPDLYNLKDVVADIVNNN